MVNVSSAFKAVSISPELLSLIVFLCGLIYFCVVKKVVIVPKYLWLLMFVSLYFICNVALNSVPAGAIIGGLRRYLKFLPLFFFPLVYEFSDEEFLQKLKLILGLSLLQFPIAFAQRFVLHTSMATGDVVRGTMSSSGILSIFLNCALAILLSFYLRKKISLFLFLSMAFLLFCPMLINETKSTLLLLPISIFIPVLFIKVDKGKFKKVIVMSFLSMGMMTIFITAYNHFWGASQSEEMGIETFLQKRASGYLYKELEAGSTDKEAGRLDSIAWAYQELSDDPMKLIFGLGMGNVGPSLISSFAGEYTKGYENYAVDMTTITYLMWEIGIFGILLLLLFFFFLLIDSFALRNSKNEIVSIVSTGWIAVVFLMTFSLVYKNLLTQNVLGFLFFMLSGYLVSKKPDFEDEYNEYPSRSELNYNYQ
jgi:hypothetical protein